MTSKPTLLLILALMSPLLPAADIHDTVETGEPDKVSALLQKNLGLLKAKNAAGDQPLHLAVQRDDAAIIELLLKAGADVNARGAKGWTPLHYAGAVDSKDACLALLEHGADRDALNDASQKPEQTAKIFTRGIIKDYNPQMAGADNLFTAIDAGESERVKTLIAGNPKLMAARDGQGRTPLILAAGTNKLEIVNLLLDAGADVNAKGRHSALTKAAEGGHLDIVRLLLKHNAEVNPSRPEGQMDSMPLRAAAFTVDPTREGADFLAKAAQAQTLSEGSPDPAALREKAAGLKADSPELAIKGSMANFFKPQPEPVREAKRTILKLLLDAGADPKKDDQAIISAAASSETEMVRLLLERGANPDAEQKGSGTAIGYAVAVGAPLPLIQMLLAAGADPLHMANPQLPLGRSALSIAVAFDRTDVIDTILAGLKPVDLSEAQHYKVIDSLMRGDPASMLRALKSGFRVNAKGPAGWTPLIRAAQSAAPEIAAVLLDAGADVKAKDDAGFTALHTAAEFGRTEQVSLLLKHGADPEAKNASGSTVLLAACTADGKEDAITALIKAGAKVDSRDAVGGTALMRAANLGKHRIVRLLLDSGADPNILSGTGYSALVSAAEGPAEGKITPDNPGARGITQSNLGSAKDYLATAELLIKHGAKANGAAEDDSLRPLYFALSAGFTDMIDLLLQNGAKVDVKAKARRTPIQGAVHGGIPELLERVISLGADPNTLVNDNGATVLHAAASLNRPQIAGLLLKHGARVNAKTTTGITPLLNAVNFKNAECVRILVKNGADPDIAATDGMTPRILATRLQQREITKIMESAK